MQIWMFTEGVFEGAERNHVALSSQGHSNKPEVLRPAERWFSSQRGLFSIELLDKN
jgi:hypothetical protein